LEKHFYQKGAGTIMTDFSTIDITSNATMDKMAGFAGLQPLLELFKAMELSEIINQYIPIYVARGYTIAETIQAIVIMQHAGGEALDHLNYCKDIFEAGPFEIPIPSPSTARARLNAFDNEEENKRRGQGKAFIPQENENLAGFAEVHFHIWKQACKLNPLKTITLDQDATFINTEKGGALFNYLKKRSYETLNTYCPEYDLIVGTRFRDGNVPPGYGQLEELKRVLDNTPAGVEKVQLRSDSAGYQIDLLRYCASGENKRFGIIDFAVSCPVVKELKEAAKQVKEKEWQPICIETKEGLKETNQEWSEVAYASAELSKGSKSEEYRFFVTREEVTVTPQERAKLHVEETQIELPLLLEEAIENLETENKNIKKLHLTEMDGKVYKIFAMVSNVLTKDGEELIKWHRGRCGKSEEVHHILKEELAGGHTVSHKFGANAAYWNIAVLALSMHSMMKQYILPEEYKSARPKTVRFIFYSIAGIIVKHARKITLKVNGKFLYIMKQVQSKLRELLKKLCLQTV
jgi:hypothetical protein